MTQAAFADLEIHIFPRQEEDYPVEIRLDGQQEFPRGYLHADILSWIPSGDSLTDGQNLFNFLFDDRSLYRAWHHAVGQFPRRRIRLWIDADAPELHTVPWELFHTGETFLAADAATPLSRYLPGVAAWGRAVLQGPLRILAAVANPTDLADYGLVSLDVEQERSVLDAAFAALPPNRRHLDFLDAPVTLARLEDRLRAGYHMLHFVGHGAFNQRQKQASLYLQDAHGNTEIVTADAFAAMLKRLDQRPHLVFLAACQTAKRDTTDAFVGFGPELVRADIPSVVAMQGDIAIPTAQTLSHTFYQHLVRHGSADLAFNEARSTLLTTQRSDAAIPVLFLRLKDGQLWVPPERHDFYQHIPLPLHYILRSDVLAPIRVALLEDPTGLVLTSGVKMNALHGMGGIGKTVVARALCDDPDIQAAFPDGILWATLGQTPNLTARLREWVETLGGIISEKAPTHAQLKNHLIQLLEQRTCLLIVDDVWQRTHAEAFQVGGASCRLLLTTRDAEIPRTLGATLQPVDVLPETQAIALLEQSAEGNLDDTSLDLKQHIVARLGCLPLALKLAGAQLRDEAPEEWLQAFAIDDLEAPRVESPHDSLVVTFAHSLDRLSARDRQRYVSLAIFREDEPVPVAAITKLWEAQGGLNQRKVVRLLKDLAARALLQITEMLGELKVTLHDLLRDFITAELGEQGIRAAHRALLDAYHTTKTGEGWHTALNDGYLYAHLVYHLDAIGDYEALKPLFADVAWMHTRVEADEYVYDGYLADLSIVWARTQAVAVSLQTETPLPLAAADCVHYALIHTSVNALASNYEPELVARAVEIGLWSPARGASVARRVVDAEKRVRMVIALLKTQRMPVKLYMDMQDLGLAATRAIEDEWDRVRILAALAPQLTEAVRETALAEGLAAARALADERYRAEALTTLAPQLSGVAREEALAEGLAAARVLADERLQAEILAKLAPLLTNALIADRLAAARAIADKRYRAEALTALAPLLTGALLAEGLAAARAIGDEWRRADVLAALAPQLAGDLLVEGLTAALAIEAEWRRTDILVALAPQLTNDLLAKGLAAACALKLEENQANVLAALAPHLTDDLLVEGIAATHTLKWEWSRAKVLAALAPQLTGALLEEGLAATRAITDEKYRARVLVALAPQLTGNLLVEGLAAMHALKWEEYKSDVLAALAPQLTDALLKEGLTVACAVADEEHRARVLAALAPQLTGALLEEGLAAARAITNEECQTKVLTALTPHLRNDLLVEGLAAAIAIEDEGNRADVLAVLAPQFTGALLEKGLAAARAIGDEGSRARVLAALAPQLTGTLLVEGLAVARTIKNEKRRTNVLAALALQLTGALLEEGLAAAGAVADEEYRARVLAALAPQLTGHIREQTLAEGLTAARAITNKEKRARVLAKLTPLLTGTAQEQALTEGLRAARAIADVENQAGTLAMLAPYLTGVVQEQALAEGLEAARAIESEWDCAKALVALAPQLTGEDRETALAEGFAAARALADENKRADVLTALAPQLTGDLLVKGLAAALAIEDEEPRARSLAALAPQLNSVSLEEGLAAPAPQLTSRARRQALAKGLAVVRAIADEESRTRIMAALAPQITEGERDRAIAEGLAAALTIADEENRTRVLVALAPQLTGDLLVEGLTMADEIEDDWSRADVLAALAPQLTGNLLVVGLTMADEIEDDWSRADVLAALAPQLTDDLLVEGLAMAGAIEDEESWERVLTAMAPQITWAAREAVLAEKLAVVREQALAEGLAAARAIEDEENRADVLAALAPQLKGVARETALAEGLTAARAIEDEEIRVQILVALAPQLTGALLAEGLAAVRAIESEGRRAQVLVMLAPQFTGAAREVVLAEELAAARAIGDERSRVKVLVALALSTNIPDSILKDIRQALLDYLWNIRTRERATLLDFLTQDDLAFLRALGISQKGYEQIAQSVIAICTQWEWL